MSMQGRIGRAGDTRVKRALGVQAILEWAFRVEKAQLDLPVRRDIDEEGFGFGMEYVLIQRARLGCKVDGGGHKSQSYTHQDAEIVAATLAGMPDSLGGKRMAIYGAELARAGNHARLAARRGASMCASRNQNQSAWRAGIHDRGGHGTRAVVR